MDEYFGKEVYVVTGGEDEDSSPIFVTTSTMLLEEHLIAMSPTIDSETRVIHGVLMPAECLPSSFRGKTVFVMGIDPTQGAESEGYVTESNCTTPDELASEIETLISMGSGAFDYKEIGIEDIYIIYGYELKVGLAINEADADEETIDACLSIADEVEEVSITHTSQENEEDF